MTKTTIHQSGRRGMNKKYTVRVNCPCFEDIEVLAETPAKAGEIALSKFRCPGNDGEVGEVVQGHIYGDNVYSEETI